eukprot:989423_1
MPDAPTHGDGMKRYILDLVIQTEESFKCQVSSINDTQLWGDVNGLFRQFMASVRKTALKFELLEDTSLATEHQTDSGDLCVSDGISEKFEMKSERMMKGAGPMDSLLNDSSRVLSIADISNLIDTVRGRQLRARGGAPYAAKTALIRSFVGQWRAPAHALVARLASTAGGAVQREVARTFGRFPTLLESVSKLLSELLTKKEDEAHKTVETFVHMELRSPFTVREPAMRASEHAYYARMCAHRTAVQPSKTEKSVEESSDISVQQSSLLSAAGSSPQAPDRKWVMHVVPQSSAVQSSKSVLQESAGSLTARIMEPPIVGNAVTAQPPITPNLNPSEPVENASSCIEIPAMRKNWVRERCQQLNAASGTASVKNVAKSVKSFFGKQASKSTSIINSQKQNNDKISRVESQVTESQSKSDEKFKILHKSQECCGKSEKYETNHEKPDEFKTKSEISEAQQIEVLDVMAMARAYFDISCERFGDDICRHADLILLEEFAAGIKHEICAGLDLLDSEHAALHALLAEDPTVSTKRAHLQQVRATLEPIARALSAHNVGVDHSDGPDGACGCF